MLMARRSLMSLQPTVIDELDAAARNREAGRMLSGQKLTPEALKHAEQLIKSASV
jgi:DNA repair ATPase RecN